MKNFFSKYLQLFVTAVLIVGVYAHSVFSMMEPKYYIQDSENSKIKEIAVVKNIRVIQSKNKGKVLYKKVTFQTLHKNPKYLFKGNCITVKDNAIIGGRYFEPKKGERVYVTVSDDDGDITSYTKLNKQMEEKFLKNPEKIKFGIGDAYLE